MARLLQCGFELQDYDNNYEFPAHTNNVANGISSIETSIVHSGSASLKITGGSTATSYAEFYTQTDPTIAGPSSDMYFRFYFYTSASPFVTDRDIFEALDSGGTSFKVRYHPFNGTLTLANASNTALATSSVISLNTWYRVEIRSEWISGASVAYLRIDGVDIGNGVYGLSTTRDSVTKFRVGKIDTSGQSGMTYYYDDIAVNDTQGSYENSWCGEGYIFHMNPDGDVSSGWALDSGAGTNTSRVSETTPDDATTYVKRTSGAPIDTYSLESPFSAGMTGYYKVKTVAASARIGATVNTTGNRTAYIKLVYSGSTSDSFLLDWSINGWATNDQDNVGSLYPLMTYTTPTGVAWSTTILQNTQVQIEAAVASTQELRVSTVWVSVEYKLINENLGNFFHFFNRHS